jgi:Carboxypeptidase regulatory-like domain
MRLFRLQGIALVLSVAFALGFVVATQQPSAYCQETTAGMVGTVTDSSGAAVPSANVTLDNTTTGVKYSETTNAIGFYRFANIPPGQGYEATFTAKGFAEFKVTSIYLTVASVRTQNAVLTVGAQVSTVEVTATNSEVTIDTTTASIGNTFDVNALNNLPVQQRNDPTALFTLQPGVTDTGSVAGARVDQNDVTVDGLDVNDFANGGAVQSNTGSGIQEGFSSSTIVGHAPVDSVEEFRRNVAGNEASTGPGSGGQFQLITKGGTNQFHGNLNEYHRDPDLVANSWFSNNATPIVPRNHLIQNQFGGNIGGPVIIPKLLNGHDKLFFFFDYGNSRIISDSVVNRVVPLNSLRNGTVGYHACTALLASGACDTVNNTTDVTKYANPAQLMALDPQGRGTDAAWLAFTNGRFPQSNASGGDGVNSGGLTFNAPNNDFETNYVGRVDWNMNDKMKLFARFTIARENAVSNPNEFPGDPVTNPVIDRSYAFVIGHDWVIGSTKTNRVILGETVQKLAFPNTYNPLNTYNPTGPTFYTFGTGIGAALASSLYLQPAFSARRIPIPILRDDFNWTRGSHNWQLGGSFKDILAHTTDAIDYNTAYLGLGGLNTSLSADVEPTDIDPARTFSFDQGFSFLLGRIGQVLSDYNYNLQGTQLNQLTGDQRMYRYYQTQIYAEDSWKANPSLTITYGVTYQYFSVPYETRGLESVEQLTFDQYLEARLKQSNSSETGPLVVPLIAYSLGGKANGSSAPPLYNPEGKQFAPHVGFAVNPGFDKKLVINASGGIVYDRTIISAVQAQQDVDSYLFQQTKPNVYGNADGYQALLNDPRLDHGNVLPFGTNAGTLTAPATPKPPYEPFVKNGVPYGLTSYQAYNSTIDPALKTPYNIIFNAGIQRELPDHMVLKVSYAGHLGRRLLAQADANQVLDFPDPKSGQLFSQAFAAITTQARAGVQAQNLTAQPWFEDVLPPSTVNTVNSNIPAGNPTASNNTQAVALNNSYGYVGNGDIGDFTAFNLAPLAPLNVGSSAQFSENSFYTNKGFSAYHALLLTLTKNRSHGLNYEFNYTFQHSIDNMSFFANQQADTGIGGVTLVCDVVRPRECRSNSDFDIKQVISADAAYDLPFGKGRMFASSMPFWANEFLGDWSLSGLTSFHTGQAWGVVSNAFVASFANDAPAILVGPKSAVKTHLTKLPGGGVNLFANNVTAAAAYQGPLGFNVGARNGLRGPTFFNADLGLMKIFPIMGERVHARFRADAFNVLNHPNFTIPAENGFNGYDQDDAIDGGPGFGQTSFTVSPTGNLNSGARVLEVSLRMEF